MQSKLGNYDVILYLCRQELKENTAMKVVNMSETPSVINQYVSELRDAQIQQDRMRFRRNLERIGEMMAFEISKGFSYKETTVQTPLAPSQCQCLSEDIVLATIFRAGLPFHQGFLNVFDRAENGFVSAFRYYKDKECSKVGVNVEYMYAFLGGKQGKDAYMIFRVADNAKAAAALAAKGVRQVEQQEMADL